MSDWWLSKSGKRLLKQVDRRWPDRDHASDGTIGDPAHSSRVSDHNPASDSSPTGVVRAVDIDADLGTPGAGQKLADQLIHLARQRRDGGRLKYVIFDGRIASDTYPDKLWRWRPYDGADPHTGHIHVSFTAAGDHDGSRFPLPVFNAPGKIRRRIRLYRRRIRRLLRRLDRLT